MSRLISLLLAFVLFGWALPRWGAALCPMFLGILLLLAALRGMVASFGGFDPTAGLGSVLVAFVGVCVALVGVGMTGHREAADGLTDWFGSLPTEGIVIGGLIVGFVLAAIADRSSR